MTFSVFSLYKGENLLAIHETKQPLPGLPEIMKISLLPSLLPLIKAHCEKTP